MKQRNKLIGLVFVMVVMVLAACGGQSSDDGDAKKPEKSGKKITIFQSKVEISEELEALAEEYTKETGVEVDVWGTTGGDFFQQLQIRLNSDQGPTIFSTNVGTESEKLKSYLYDMSNEDYIKHIAPGMELMIDDKYLGIPYGIEGFGLVYNKDLVTSEDITDYDSFVTFLAEAKEKGFNGIELARETSFLLSHIFNTPFALQEDPVAFIADLNSGAVTMPEVDEFQEFAKFMVAIKDYTKNPLETPYDAQIGDFAGQDTAMIHQGNWAYNMFADYDLDFEMDVMPLPLSGNDKLSVGTGKYWVINNNATEDEIKEANKFLEWMHTSELGKQYIVEKFNFIPALTNIEAKDLDPLSQTILEYSNSGNTIPSQMYKFFPDNIIDNDLIPVIEDFFLTDDVTAEQLLVNLQKAWTDNVN